MSSPVNDPVQLRSSNPQSNLVADGLGFVGPDIPIDVLLATGRPFGHLPWMVDEPTRWADQWLEAGFPRWARSILEQWHAGVFDRLHVVVFSRSDDASQRLFYYVRELQQRKLLGGPRAMILDLALIPRESSLAHSVAAIESMAKSLGVGDEALRSGVARADALRLSLRGLQQRREGGVYFERMARAALWSDATAWISEVAVPVTAPARRLLLAGSVPPDGRLHRVAEQAGGCVVDETHVHALGRLGMPLAEPDPLIARHVARQLIGNASGPRAFLDRAGWIVRRAREARAVGVIIWLTREDEALAWHVPAMRAALAAAALPCLVLAAASWRADETALDSVAQFCRSLPS